MKHATHDNGLIRDEQGNFVGVNLGWDFTAEHEWGTKGIKRDLGIDDKGYGPDRYKVRNAGTIFTQETGKRYVISSYGQGDFTKFLPNYDTDKDVIAAWSDRSFVVSIKDKTVYDAIMNALTTDDAIITNEQMFASERNPFSNSGLKIIIRSAIPQEWQERWIEAHKDYERLLKASEKTGIETRLREAGKSWFALSPRWLSDIKGGKSIHPVIYWLNPMEQNKHNYGWFTVEDLEQWINDVGPIPMTKVQQ